MGERIPLSDTVTIPRQLAAGARLSIIADAPLDPEAPGLTTTRLSWWPDGRPEEARQSAGYAPAGVVDAPGVWIIKAEASPLAVGYSGALAVDP